VAIRRSSSADVEALIAELRASLEDDSRREAVYARLAVIGRRAVGHILEALPTAGTTEEHAALLLALERIPDLRSVEPVLAAIEPASGNARVRLAAARVARPLLDVPSAATALLERLTTIVLDRREPSDVRRAALEAMSDLPVRTLRPLKQRLADDPDPAIRSAALGREQALASDAATGIATLEQHFPDDPDAVLESLGRGAADSPLSTLHAVLKSVREKEATAGRRRADWISVRGAIHLALARRDSRVALYDLREAFEAGDSHPLPAEFLTAVVLIGNGSCLEPLARAWMHAPGLGRRNRAGAWARQVREAVVEILSKERTASRRKILGRLQQRWSTGEDAQRLRELVEPSGRQ